MANQRMAAALKAKGYSYQYVYSEGARHTDANVILQTLPRALEWSSLSAAGPPSAGWLCTPQASRN
jgi:hypothetical protein